MFCRGPDSKDLGLCGPHGHCPDYSTRPLQDKKQVTASMQMNWTWLYSYKVLFMVPEISISYSFPMP